LRYPYSGDAFRHAREKAGLSRVQLAAQAHVFVYEVMHLEAGKQVPPNKYSALMAVLQPYLPALRQREYRRP
jgi:DNA-binding transcriptional regulator YiaG